MAGRLEDILIIAEHYLACSVVLNSYTHTYKYSNMHAPSNGFAGKG
jgi:hypothetical protein